MKTERRETRPERRDTRKTSPRAWQKPDFVELSACAEIGAYAFTA
jgi:hypothetical protein